MSRPHSPARLPQAHAYGSCNGVCPPHAGLALVLLPPVVPASLSFPKSLPPVMCPKSDGVSVVISASRRVQASLALGPTCVAS